MTELLKSNMPYVWLDKCEASFQELKTRITTTVGDSPEGALKQPGESCLKPAKNQNKTPLT
jgi:hypothetical protein